MARSGSKKSSVPSSTTDQTLEQYLGSQPSIYIVAENLHPRDLSKTEGEEGYRIMGAFSTLEVANGYARRYAYGLMKWGSSTEGAIWAEEDLNLADSDVRIKQSIDSTDGTHEYVVTWTHFTTIKVARWLVRDTAPAVDSNTEFFDRVDFVADSGTTDSVYAESDGDDSVDEDDDADMEDLKDELQGLNVDRKTAVGELIDADYHGQ